MQYETGAMQYETEVYRPPADIPEKQKDESHLGRIFQVLTWIVLAALLLVWAVVGFVFWFPKLVREMAIFSVALVHATMTRGDMEPSGDRLKEAISFYRTGFEMAYGAVITGDGPSGTVKKQPISADRLFKETLWAAVVWWVLLSLIGAISWTPVALGVWVLSGAWIEALDSLVIRFWTWADGVFD